MSDESSNDFNIRLTNLGLDVNLNDYPYTSRCALLETLRELHSADQRTDPNSPVLSMNWPCSYTSTVYVILSYLQTGQLPRLLTGEVYNDVHTCLQYLNCQDIDQITMHDFLLNVFTIEDTHINKSLTVETMYNDNGSLKPLEEIQLQYPELLAAKGRVKFPTQEEQAVDRLTRCDPSPSQPGCSRRDFIRSVQSKCPYLALAGGCLHLARTRDYSNMVCNISDLDFFLVGYPSADISPVLEMIGNEYRRCFGNFFSLLTKHAMSFFRLSRVHRNTTQVILKQYANLGLLFDGFDLDASCFAYFQEKFWYNARSKRIIQNPHNLVDVRRQSPSFEYRLLKYNAKYGIGVAVPGYIYYRLHPTQPPFLGLARMVSCSRPSVHYCLDYDKGNTILTSSTVQTLLHNIGITQEHPKHNFEYQLQYNSVGNHTSAITEEKLENRKNTTQPWGWFVQAYGGKVSDFPISQTSYPGQPVPTNPNWEVDIGGFKITSATSTDKLRAYIESCN
jgi:hypothetical protein